MSLSCGFATNSTIPEAHQMPIASQRGIKISPAWRLDRSANRSGVAVLQSQGLRSAAPLLGLIAVLRLHLPFGSEAFWVLLALSQETR